MRACAGPEPGSSMPHGARRACRACRMGDANGNAAQTGGLARQVRQRMNRLGKPEHRARFCFFSKKKSRAGTRRFPITLEIQIPMGFNRSAASFATPKTFLQSPSFAGAKRQPHPLESPPHNVPPCSPTSRRFTPPRPPKPPHLSTSSHHRAPRSYPIARMRRARAGFQSAARYSKSMPRLPHGGCKRKCRPNRRLGAASAAKDEPARQARAPRALLLLF